MRQPHNRIKIEARYIMFNIKNIVLIYISTVVDSMRQIGQLSQQLFIFRQRQMFGQEYMWTGVLLRIILFPEAYIPVCIKN